MKILTRNNLLRVIILCIVAGTLILLDGIWLQLLSDTVAGKLATTLIIIVGACALIYAVLADITADTSQKKDKYLN